MCSTNAIWKIASSGNHEDYKNGTAGQQGMETNIAMVGVIVYHTKLKDGTEKGHKKNSGTIF